MWPRPESELEEMLRLQIAEIKRQHPVDWADPQRLAATLGVRLVMGQLGDLWEGAALPGHAVVNTESGGSERQRFTAYHELVHHLIRSNDELLSHIHDQYRTDEDLERFVELLSNLGAAEFLIPRATVRESVGIYGFSLQVVRELKSTMEASLSAICMQLVRCASHRCAIAICRLERSEAELPLLAGAPSLGAATLRVVLGAASPSMKYRLPSDVSIPRQHLLAEAYESGGDIIRGRAALPFRHNQDWVVECEAMRVGGQVVGLFHVDQRPPSSKHQPCLF